MKTNKAILILPELELPTVIEVNDDLATLQKAVGGNIEMYPLDRDGGKFHAYINEDGKMLALPFNPVATAVVEHYWPGFTQGDEINGPFLVLGSGEDGEESDVPQDAIDYIMGLTMDYIAKMV
ncbi:hypothetical protein CMI47_10210 [Candidatus Pacearchaeota archaeon]|nr:hypothetical protein [Candidatus Pacearchaeota archaeon]